MSYRPQDQLTDPARPTAEPWRTLVGIAAMVFGTLLLTGLWVALVPLLGFGWLVPGTTPAGMIWILSSFVCPLIMLWAVVRVLHRRSLATLIGPVGPAWWQFRRVLAVQAAVLLLAILLPSPEGMTPVAGLAFGPWLSWLVPALVFLVIQVGVEELAFRGYLQSQLAARAASPFVWIGVPAVLFALLHYDPGAGGNAWAVVCITFIFALVAGDLTARTGTLGPALALHLANNFGALMLVGARGPMEGLALYVVPVDMSDPALLPVLAVEAVLIVISWLGARIVLRV